MLPFNPLTSPLVGQQLIEASAGTGKTYSIAFLYLRLIIERQLAVDQILVVTFTTAATDELRTRIRTRIRDLLDLLEDPDPGNEGADPLLLEFASSLQKRSGEVKLQLQDALTRMDEAAIYTIHSFCQRMLQDNAFESGMPFAVDFLESESSLRSRIMEDFWRRRFYQAEPAETQWALGNWQGPEQLIQDLQVLLARPSARTVPEVTSGQVEEARAGCRGLWNEVRTAWAQCADEVTKILQDDPCLKRSKETYGEVPLQEALGALESLVASDSVVWQLPGRVELFAASVMADNLKGKKIAPDHPFFTLFDSFYLRQAELVRVSRIHTLAEAHQYLREELDRRKRQKSQMYFNDLLSRLDQALAGSRGEHLVQQIRNRFKVALVDEFQDTDPLQYRIFHTLFGRGAEPGLFMIGDPKQSIYSFRGADIFAYMQASRDTPESSSFTMDRNYRATSPMVEAVNSLFDRHAAFVFAGEIDYHRVLPGPDADTNPLLIQGGSVKPLQVQLLSVDRDATPGQKTISKDRARYTAAAWTAHEIARLLILGQEGEAVIGERPLAGGDLAILVRTHREAELMQNELLRLNIASVYYSQDSIYETAEAGQIYHVLRAFLDLTDEPQVCNALVTDIFGLNAGMLHDLRSDREAWEILLAEFAEYQDLWRRSGVTAMFHRLLFNRGVVRRLVGISGGERKLTNFLHLVELLQEASGRYKGDDLVCWFREQMNDPGKDAANQQLRLESDENLVKIVTIHKAKGLEYPVVFLPFLWGARTVGAGEIFSCHINEKGRSAFVVDLGSGDEERYLQAEKERLAEDLRILYVALTRARHCCYFAWGRISKMDHSALAWLLHRDEDGTMPPLAEMSEEQMVQHLNVLDRDHVSFVPFPSEGEASPAVRKMPLESLSVRSFTGNVDTSWSVTSYSRLLAPKAGHYVPASPAFPGAGAEPETSSALSAFTFPKGATAGNCLHGLLENIDFSHCAGEDLQKLSREWLRKSGIDLMWAPVLQRWVENIVATPLSTEPLLRLDRLSGEDRKAELGFYFGMHDFDPGRLNQILADFAIPRVEMQTDLLKGLMRGYIDLIFRADGRYYIADYKSNYLGPDREDYSRPQMQAAMLEHRYDLQYLVYTVALHRYLQNRIPQYDYTQYFGGVFYLFLRGMHPDQGPGCGVWYDLPSPELIIQLDSCFGREEVH